MGKCFFVVILWLSCGLSAHLLKSLLTFMGLKELKELDSSITDSFPLFHLPVGNIFIVIIIVVFVVVFALVAFVAVCVVIISTLLTWCQYPRTLPAVLAYIAPSCEPLSLADHASTKIIRNKRTIRFMFKQNRQKAHFLQEAEKWTNKQPTNDCIGWVEICHLPRKHMAHNAWLNRCRRLLQGAGSSSGHT